MLIIDFQGSEFVEKGVFVIGRFRTDDVNGGSGGNFKTVAFVEFSEFHNSVCFIFLFILEDFFDVVNTNTVNYFSVFILKIFI